MRIENFIISILLCACFTLMSAVLVVPNNAQAEEIPRTIIALYDSKEEEYIATTWTHTLAEMPLNHMGLKLEYYDINKPLPDIADRNDVRGVLSWQTVGTTLADPVEYLNWAIKAAKKGKRFVIMGNPGFYEDKKGAITPIKLINEFFGLLGFKDTGEWTSLTYNVNFTYADPQATSFERDFSGILQPFEGIVPVEENATSYLVAKRASSKSESHLAFSTSKGGYIANGYAHYYDRTGESSIRQWYINPFIFFKDAFGTREIPKPDTTTLAGRRIYYSHIDGDGWNNVTLIEKYRDKQMISAEVIYKEILSSYTDLPVTVGVIAADIDKEWVGTKDSRKVAKDILALPHIEIGSHTYSHPLDWDFFAAGDINKKEQPYLAKYPFGSWGKPSTMDVLLKPLDKLFETEEHSQKELLENYIIPRAYANKPFDLDQEIAGAVKTIESLAPAGKKVTVVQWSGNTSPFEEAIGASRKIGIRNINGGDSRFDQEFLSYGYVSPLGKQVGSEYQVYTSNSNENTYTDLWSGRYYGFKYLIKTFENTESPIRVKPLNVYYHMYSGERTASLNALINNLDYARSQKIIPIEASTFAGIVDGFVSTQIEPLAKNRWQIKNRQDLQTIRFDDANNQWVDFSQSTGIVGQKHYQNSLYVYLDSQANEPIIALSAEKTQKNRAYLVDSRWKVRALTHNRNTFSFSAQGYGEGLMQWRMAKNGTYSVSIDNEEVKNIQTNQAHILSLNLGSDGLNTRHVTIEYQGI